MHFLLRMATALVFTLLFPSIVLAYEEPTRWTVADVEQALEGASGTVRCVFEHETGSTFNPYSLGDGGTSFGPIQLHTPGELETFYSQGWTDPYSPYQSRAFLERAIAEGRLSAWHVPCG